MRRAGSNLEGVEHKIIKNYKPNLSYLPLIQSYRTLTNRRLPEFRRESRYTFCTSFYIPCLTHAEVPFQIFMIENTDVAVCRRAPRQYGPGAPTATDVRSGCSSAATAVRWRGVDHSRRAALGEVNGCGRDSSVRGTVGRRTTLSSSRERGDRQCTDERHGCVMRLFVRGASRVDVVIAVVTVT